MSDPRATLGQSGEDLAADYLVRAGYTILVRNYRQNSGEIDIIAEEKGTLVFIEVKTRKNLAFGSPAAAVTPRKQRQISKVAQEYLMRHNLFDRPARFDVVSILMGRVPVIEVVPNAFDLC